jgi:WD40 repeat protein
MVFDIWNADATLMFEKKPNDWHWSPDGSRLLLLFDDGNCFEYDLATRKSTHGWTWPIDKQVGQIIGGQYHPNGKWVTTISHLNNEAILWDVETGKVVQSLGPFDLLLADIRYSADGKLVTLVGFDECKTVECETGKVVSDFKLKGGQISRNEISSDGSRILTRYDNEYRVIDTRTEKVVFSIKPSKATAFDGSLSPSGKYMLSAGGRLASLWDVDAQKKVMDMTHLGMVKDMRFNADETRILTVDSVGGGSVWQIEPQAMHSSDDPAITKGAKRLASIVLMKNGDWLVYDDAGRFDATDPSNVTGAYFVLDWAGGLEPIAMTQLKSQFYEPNLLGKVMGLDKEPLRDVPSIQNLHLYPEISVKPTDKPFVYDVQAKDRDDGGIGKLSFCLNGKQFLSKKGSSYIQLDLTEYKSFMLPENRLEGTGNQLAVTVSNADGTLTSLPVTVDIGVPSDLKAPDVRIHALFVGVGDYPGTAGDLKAPPSDATALELAVRTTAEKLIPGRVDTTTLTTKVTEVTGRPTKARILQWFTDTAKDSSSSDILMVFFAGHGMSRVGDQSGYYFLTSDADPGNVTPASAATSMISGDELKAAMSAIPANKQIVILDTCHSGAATDSLLSSNRSISGEYQRAWEGIRDTTGTWLLAGSASDQLSYESSNVDHGMLTYSLLEAINNASPEGLRETPSGQKFVDVEKWLGYAANRVESLKAEVGVKGVQRPEFRRATQGSSFDIGVVDDAEKGILNLKPPMPVAIVGSFQNQEEDPIGLEPALQKALEESTKVKAWFDVPKHPNVYRVAGTYETSGTKVKLKLYIQRFDAAQTRSTLQTIELEGDSQALDTFAKLIRTSIEEAILKLNAPPPTEK